MPFDMGPGFQPPKITLKTLATATAQEVFDQVAGHLLRQNQLSEVDSGTPDHRCVYRGPNGLMCAAGCLIGADEYDAVRFEGSSWGRLRVMDLVPVEHVDLIYKLQVLHDTYPPDTWPGQLRITAEQFGLSCAAVTA